MNRTATQEASTMIDSATRRAVYAAQLRIALADLTPNCPGGRYSGQQRNYAKGIARRRALAIFDGATDRPTEAIIAAARQNAAAR